LLHLVSIEKQRNMHFFKVCSSILASLATIAACTSEGTQLNNGSSGTATGGNGVIGSSNGGAKGSMIGGAGGTGTQGTFGGSTTTGSALGGVNNSGGARSATSSNVAGGSSSGGTTSGGTTSGGTTSGGTTNSSGGARTSTSGTVTGGSSATGGKSNSGGVTAVGGSTGGRSNTGGGAGNASTATGGRSSTGGTTGTAGTAASYRPCPTDGAVCKIMPFGDSITDGYNQDTPGGYRVELFRLAHSAGKNITFVGSNSNGPSGNVDGVTFPTNHEGHSGWTIAPAGGRSGISTLVATVMPKFTPHIVLLMIGTNDAIDNYDMANAPARLDALIGSIYTQLPNVLIVVAQPVPSRGDANKGDDTTLSARIKTFNDAIPAVIKARADAGKHILLVDMYTPFNANKANLIEDQWHPNLAGYVVLGTQWYSVLKPLL